MRKRAWLLIAALFMCVAIPVASLPLLRPFLFPGLPGDPLGGAARSGDHAMVDRLLASGAPVNAWCSTSDPHHRTRPLHKAAAHGDPVLIKRLLAAGADVNGRDAVGNTALWDVIVDGQRNPQRLACLKVLVDAGIDVNARNRRGSTGLGLAVSYAQPDSVDYLCQNGADVNARDHEGKTPLHWVSTALEGREEMAKILLAHGADVNIRDISGESAGDAARDVIGDHSGSGKEQ